MISLAVRFAGAHLGFRDPLRAERGMQTAASLRHDLSNSRASNEQLRAKLEAAEKPRRVKPRGVIVSRVTGDGLARDEWPNGETWNLYPLGASGIGLIEDGSGTPTEEAWLWIRDADNRAIATYKPGYWYQVEAGRLVDINEIKEGTPPE